MQNRFMIHGRKVTTLVAALLMVASMPLGALAAEAAQNSSRTVGICIGVFLGLCLAATLVFGIVEARRKRKA